MIAKVSLSAKLKTFSEGFELLRLKVSNVVDSQDRRLKCNVFHE